MDWNSVVIFGNEGVDWEIGMISDNANIKIAGVISSLPELLVLMRP